MTTTTMTSKGQVTIPKHVREATGLKPGGKVEVAVEDGVTVVRPVGRTAKSDFARRLEKLRGTLKSNMSTDEIMEFLRGD